MVSTVSKYFIFFFRVEQILMLVYLSNVAMGVVHFIFWLIPVYNVVNFLSSPVF